jgi:putative transposase
VPSPDAFDRSPPFPRQRIKPFENSSLAKQLVEHSCRKQEIAPGQLTIHADRSSSMTSKALALLMADLGVVNTHSGLHVSGDNPFSGAQFKTM